MHSDETAGTVRADAEHSLETRLAAILHPQRDPETAVSELIRIRKAVAADAPDLLDLAREMHRNSTYKWLDFDDGKVLRMYSTLAQTGYLRVAVVQGKIAGAMAAYMTEYFFGKDKLAQELGLYVRQERRGGMAAIKLVRDMVKWAYTEGAKEIVAGTTAVLDPRIALIYTRVGFKGAGDLLKMRVGG